ncbi:FtsX-like permease family protein [Nocardia sp. NPDC046763]|uniref:FtsX-like permease family protein n=1 Tax=Nocardia sp. NPDC046763 TaxID=3155256 RepID=UPI0033CC343F
MTLLPSPILRFHVLALRDSLTHWARTLILVGIVTVSTTLLVAVLSTYGSITTSVAQLSSAIAGRAAFTVHATTDTGVEQSISTEVRRIAGVSAAVPVVQRPVKFERAGSTASALLLGSDASITALGSRLTESILPAVAAHPEFLSKPNAVLAGSATGLTVGERITVGGSEVEVVGVVRNDGLDAGKFLLAQLNTAQRLIGATGRVSGVQVVLADGADREGVQRDLRTLLTDRYLVSSPDYAVAAAAGSTSLISTSSLMVVLVAFVVAVFLMFNTMHMSIGQRSKLLSVLRAIGANPTLLYAHLLAEAALWGLVGGGIGIGLGFAVGRTTIGYLPAFAIQSISATIQYSLAWYVPLLALIAALLCCSTAAAGAGVQIYRMSPVGALGGSITAGRTDSRLSRVIGALGVVLLVITAAVVSFAHGQAVLVAAATLPLGVLAVMFAGTQTLVSCCARITAPFGAVGLLAASTLTRVPRRTWTNVATVVVTITVAVGVSGALTAMANSATSSYASLADTDIYVTRTPADVLPAGDLIDPAAAEAIGKVADAVTVIPGQWTYADFGGSQVTVQGLMPGSHAVTLAAMSEQTRERVLAGDGIVISEQLARARSWTEGSDITLTTPSGPHQVHVLQVISTISVAGGTAAMSLPQLQSWYDRLGATYYEVTIRQGADRGAVMKQLQAALPRDMYVYSGDEAVRGTTSAIGQAGIIAVALEWIIAAVAAIGLLNTFTLSVLERRQQIGVLRAIGALRSQTTSMILVEGMAVGAVGGAIGFVAGLALQYLSCKVLGIVTGFPVPFTVSPVAALVAVGAVAICLFGALVPALGAGRTTVVEALANR